MYNFQGEVVSGLDFLSLLPHYCSIKVWNIVLVVFGESEGAKYVGHRKFSGRKRCKKDVICTPPSLISWESTEI